MSINEHPVIKLATIQPTPSAGIASTKNNGKMVSASDNLNCIIPDATVIVGITNTTYNDAISPALAINFTVLFNICSFTELKKVAKKQPKKARKKS